MAGAKTLRRIGLVAGLSVPWTFIGCESTPVDLSEFTRGPAPLRLPSLTHEGNGGCYEDALQGHQVFEMYCAACHNARALGERPYSSYQNAAQHMRVRANLTGVEYARLMEFLRRWHDVPAPEQHEEPSPKRFFFSQPIPEFRQQPAEPAPGLPAGPRAGMNDQGSPGQPPVGGSPREAR
jgi:hypothetical protein